MSYYDFGNVTYDMLNILFLENIKNCIYVSLNNVTILIINFCLLSSRMVDFKVQQRRYRSKEKTIVSTIYGPVKGVKRKSIYGDAYFSFEKIPFAKPPVGELRYKAPQPPEPWSEVRSCTSTGPKPLQKHFVFQMTDGSEDCLYLNVYTKNVSTPYD